MHWLTSVFQDRRDAGRKLAARLEERLAQTNPDWRETAHVIVLGIPRGGVIVAQEIARALYAPLDIFLTHKLGAPGNPELAIGAVTADGTYFINADIAQAYGISPKFIQKEMDSQLREIHRREGLYRQDRPPLDLAEKTVILVDDGIATGATTVTALRALRKHRPARLILASPVAPHDIQDMLARECDEVVILVSPRLFLSVGHVYEHFDQTTDAQVIAALQE